MQRSLKEEAISRLGELVRPIAGEGDVGALLELIGESDIVLLGEATHGTHEFYRMRVEITKRLIQEKGFTIIAWESDWPDALRVHRYIRARSDDANATDALGDYKRFPRWMWRNTEVVELVGWLRAHNDKVPRVNPKAGVYGLDLYSLHSSIASVIEFLEKADPQAAQEARRRYGCFEEFGDDPQIYGMSAGLDKTFSCEEEVIQQLVELQQRANELLKQDGRVAADELFFAQQNATVALEAERYFRAMFRGRPNTWNMRDTHMADTLDRLMEHLQRQGERPKAVVWAHNSHLGDASATSTKDRGEINLGQILRQRHGNKVISIGFTTYEGTVTAASDWGATAERKRVRPALQDSYERLFPELEIPAFTAPMRGSRELKRLLGQDLLERAIGVIYAPETERWSHYFYARLPSQFDAIIHFDKTRALQPLERTSEWIEGELPETYPSAV